MSELYNTIKQGLVRMMARQLDYSPAATDLRFVIETMYDDLIHYGLTDEDAPRVRQAMESAGANAHRWPTATTIRDYLPKKERAIKELPPPPPKTVEQQMKARTEAERCKIWLYQNGYTTRLPVPLRQEVENAGKQHEEKTHGETEEITPPF